MERFLRFYLWWFMLGLPVGIFCLVLQWLNILSKHGPMQWIVLTGLQTVVAGVTFKRSPWYG